MSIDFYLCKRKQKYLFFVATSTSMICAQNDSDDESDDDNDDMDTEYYGKFIYISINTTCVQFLAHQS